jgi:maltose O-acetyltransferase
MKRISIGSNSSIGRGCILFPGFVHKNAFISIGNNVWIAPGVTFLVAGHDHTSLDLPDIAGNIIVRDNVWIGMGSTIVGHSGGGGGILIGEGAVIGAGSLVVKDVPSWSIVGGVPAKKIKERILIKSGPTLGL